MKVIHTSEVAGTEVSMDGVEGVKMRALLTAEDGAPGFTLREFSLAPGGHTPRHAHAHEHQVIVSSGAGTLWSQEREHALRPGVVALVEPDEEHQFRAGPEGMVFFCIVPHAGHQ